MNGVLLNGSKQKECLVNNQTTVFVRTRNKRVLLSLLFFFLVISVIASARYWFASAKPINRASPRLTTATAPRMPGEDVPRTVEISPRSSVSVTEVAGTRLPARFIILKAGGFEPTEVHWPKGEFFLVLENRSGVDDVTLRVDREVGGRLKEVKVNLRRHRWSGVVDFAPGNYLVTEVNHPNWHCRIVVVPR
jgi:hypothetical protein